MIQAIEAIGIGAVFGWMLHRGGLTHYERIVDLYRLRDMTVMKFMLSALATGAVLVEGRHHHWIGRVVADPADAGGCEHRRRRGVRHRHGWCRLLSGTIVAQAGEGRLDAWGPRLIGLLSGALAFKFIEPSIMPALARIGSLGYTTFGKLLGVAPLLLVIVCAELALLAFAVARRRQRAHQPAAHS